MHLLLPPSEAKISGGRGQPMRRRFLDQPDGRLWATRRRAVEALLQLLEGGAAEAADALVLPRGVAAAALEADAKVLDTRTTPALRRYSGVVYTGLDHRSLSATQQRTAARSTLIFSGLWGVVRGDEPIPEYRVPAKASLPGLGTAATFWRPCLDEVVPGLVRRGLIVDLRSSDYAAMWRPKAELARRVVSIRVLSPAPRGGHAVISHASKLAKGRLAAALVRRVDSGLVVGCTDDVVAAWADCGGVDARLSATGVDLFTA